VKIAVTADLHLTKKEEHPERFHALEDIFRQMIQEKIAVLIIAGDLFNEENRNYSEFDELCRHPKHRHIQFHIIPGNHDLKISAKSFASENITVYSAPELKQLDLMSLPILLLPYRKEQTMGEGLAAFDAELRRGEWILISHGDWVEGIREPNPFEPGVYMPLGRSDVETTKPIQVVLGHIHKPFDKGNVHYPGSPCGLDITETGRRRFLILNTETGLVKAKAVETEFLYFDEWLVVLPVQDETTFVQKKLEAMFRNWDTQESEKKRIILRLKVSGYTADKQRLSRIIKDHLKGMRFYLDGEPDLTDVSITDDTDRSEIARQLESAIESLGFRPGPDDPDREMILLHALHTVYGAP
jgi:exonuclease SbcD